jgi:DNA-binding GntR family transcriptional regulator
MSVLGAGQSTLSTFQPRRNMRDEIIDVLRGAVIAGELRPNQVYSAPILAQQFGVSPTPVREAMIQLANDGLFEPVRNKGFRVVEPSSEELDEMADLRMLLEVPTVRRLAEVGVLPEQVDRLRPLAEGIEQAAADHDLIAHVTIDIEFHCLLLDLAGNRQLVDMVRTLKTRSRISGLKDLADADMLIPSSHEHAELLDLIASGDADGAEAMMRGHIGHVRGIWATRDGAEHN